MSYEFTSTNDFLEGTFNLTYDSEGITLGLWLKMSASDWGLSNQGYCLTFYSVADSLTDTVRLTHTKGAADRISASSRDLGGDNDAHNVIDKDHDDIWQLFFATFTSDTLREATAQDSTDQGNNTSSRPVGASLQFIRVGSSPVGQTFCDGFLGECAIWNKVLSDAEIDTVWISEGVGNSMDSVAPANLLGYWPLIIDQTTHVNLGVDTEGDLTVSNATWSSDNPTIIHTNASVLSDSFALIDTEVAFTLRPRSFADDFVIVDSVEMLRKSSRSIADSFLPTDDSVEMLRIAQHALANDIEVTEETFAGYTSGEAPVVVDTVLRKTEGITDAVPETPWG